METGLNKNDKDMLHVLQGASINFLGTLLGNILRFLYVFFIAKILSQADLGLFSLGLTILKFFVVVSVAGLDSGILRFIALYRGENDHKRMKGVLDASLCISIPLSVLVGAGLFYFSELLSTTFFNKPELTEVVQLFSISIPFFTVTIIFLSALQSLKFMRYKVYTREIGENVFKFIFTAIFLLFGWRINGVVLANTVSFFFVAGLSYYFARKVFSHDSFGLQSQFEFKKLLAFSFPNSISEITVRFIMWTDIFMLGYFSESKELGIYYIVTGIIFIGVIFIESFASVFNPTIADLYNRKQISQLSDLYKIVSKWIFIASFPFYLVVIFYAKSILNIYGEGFISGALSLSVLGGAYILYTLIGLSGYVLLMIGKSWINMFTNLLGCFLNIGLNYIFIPKYGILGAALASGFSLVCVNIFRLFQVYFFVRVHPFNKAFLKPLLAGLGALSLISGFSRFVVLSNIYGDLAFGVSLFLATYAIVLFLLGFEKEDMMILDKFRNKFVKGSVT